MANFISVILKNFSLEFSNGKFTKKVEHYFDDYLKDVEKMSLVDNYVNSVYEALVGWYPGMYLPDIFICLKTALNLTSALWISQKTCLSVIRNTVIRKIPKSSF